MTTATRTGGRLLGNGVSDVLGKWHLWALAATGLLGIQPSAAQTPVSITAPTGQSLVVVMLPFDGKELGGVSRKAVQPMPTALFVRDALMARDEARFYRVTEPDAFAGLARLKYRGRTVDLRAMAKLLRADVLIGGWLEATPGADSPTPYRLNLAMYDGQGQLVGQLAYDMEGPALDRTRFLSQATAFCQMLDAALKIPKAPLVFANDPRPAPVPQSRLAPAGQTGTPASGPVGTLGPVVQAEDAEAAPLSGEGKPLVPLSAQAQQDQDQRPPWQAALDLQVGYLYSSRSLSSEGGVLAFPRAGASGVFLQAALYPAAFVRSAGPALSGLGLRLSLQLPKWGTIEQVTPTDSTPTGSYKASERRFEGGLRWHYNPWDALWRPDFEIEGLFGVHQFVFSEPVNVPFLRLPSSDYRYLGALAGLRLFPIERLSFRVALSLGKHLSLGPMATVGIDPVTNLNLRDQNGFQSYGPGSGWLWRLDLGSTVEIWRGLFAGAAFSYTQNRLSFDGQGNIFQTTGTPVTRVQDDQVTLMLTVGYVYRGRRLPQPSQRSLVVDPPAPPSVEPPLVTPPAATDASAAALPPPQ